MFKRSRKNSFNPRRDWLLILTIFSLFLIMVVLYNMYVFKAVGSGTFVEVLGEEVTVKTVQKDTLLKAVEVITTKEKNRGTILNGGYDVEDPSL